MVFRSTREIELHVVTMSQMLAVRGQVPVILIENKSVSRSRHTLFFSFTSLPPQFRLERRKMLAQVRLIISSWLLSPTVISTIRSGQSKSVYLYAI